MVNYRSGKPHLARSRKSSCPLVKTLYKLNFKGNLCLICHPRVGFNIMEKQMIQMLRLKAKVMPNKTIEKRSTNLTLDDKVDAKS